MIYFCVFFGLVEKSFSQQESFSAELNGDVIEYSIDGNIVTAEGNVKIIYGDVTLYCDKVEFFRDTNMAYADGHVRLISKATEITGEKIIYNFVTMTGELNNARFYSAPYYGAGKHISKVSEDKIIISDGYITTSDYDDPGFRITSKTIDLYPQDKLIARNVRPMVGDVPIMYLPKFTQNLKDKKPMVTFSPGYDKRWGAFLLTDWRAYYSENLKANVHVDLRELLGIGTGFDVDYDTKKYGSGLLETYYTQERAITSDRFYEERPSPTKERQRYKIEWRHKWQIDQKTNTIWQYYLLSDGTFVKDFFKREHDEDISPSTYFLLTRTLPLGILSARTDVRINRFTSSVERLPEIRYDLTNTELGDSGVYFKNRTAFSSLVKKPAAPSDVKDKTLRFDTDNELSYPMKISFIDFKPFVGGRKTYYTDTKDSEKKDSLRSIFRSGASLSTKFYRIFDVDIDAFGLKVNRLRHIITPSILYQFVNDPSIEPSQLVSFDSIDRLDKKHSINFSLENKLQTKRNEKTIELLRFIVGVDYHLKEDPLDSGFNVITADVDFKPTDWLTFYFDSDYDTKKDRLTAANFDIYINRGSKWSFGLGKRYNRDADDQITTELSYIINPKWSLRFFNRFDVDEGTLKEQEYRLVRDLHSWEMEILYNQTRGEGSEILFLFRLKAFPDIRFDFGSSFHRRKAGSQSSEGD